MSNPFGGMAGMGGMMKQVKQVYENVQKVQQELAEEKVEATSGGGMVRAVVNGQGELLEVKIDPQVVDSDDVEMLEDLVVTAVREAITNAKQMAAERVNEATGGLAGMGFPGMF